MAKLTGAKKKEFLERMAKGRKKSARANPKKKATRKKKKPAAKKKAPRKAAKKPTRKNTSVRRAKKAIGKAFTKPVAAEWAKAKRKKKAKKTARRATRNPRKGKRRNGGAEDAAAMFETFHQMQPKRILKYEELVKFPGNFAEIGRPLKELRVFLDDANPDFAFTGFGDCQVVCTPDGANIYFVGGDQSINLQALGITTDKDTVELGPCTYICYHTVKGFHDFTPTDYWHRFGEEDGIFPRLGYDCLNQRLFLIGGNYQAKREGIVN